MPGKTYEDPFAEVNKGPDFYAGIKQQPTKARNILAEREINLTDAEKRQRDMEERQYESAHRNADRQEELEMKQNIRVADQQAKARGDILPFDVWTRTKYLLGLHKM